MYYQKQIDFKPDEVLDYLRKSQSDDPLLSVEEVLARHETILDELAVKYLGGVVPEQNKFREVASGETLAERTEIQKVLRLIESPKYKAVMCVEPQRLTRGDLEDIGRLMKLLKHTNTIVITRDRIYDLRDEYDWEAFERELKRGNEYLAYTKKILLRGRLLSVSEGNYIGSIAPYGYEKTSYMEGKKKCHSLKIKEDEANVVRMIFDMYVNQDLGRVTIARRLNDLGIRTMHGALWAQDTIKDMLENVHYIGKVRWNWRKTIQVVEDGVIRNVSKKSKVGEYLVYDGKHEAIISDELFEAAQAKQGRNHRAKPGTKVRNPLAGLLFCRCGRSMSYRMNNNKGKKRAEPRLLCDNQVYCKTSGCIYDELIEKVIEVLEQCIEDFEVRIKNNDGDSRKLHANLVKHLEASLKELEKKEISQWEKYTEEGMPKHIFDTLNAKVLREKEEINQALCTARQSMPDPIDYEEKLYRFRDALEALKDPSVDAAKKNKLLKACIERIDYSREKSERVKNPEKRVKINGKYEKPNKLQVGGSWISKPIELDVKLRV